MNKKQSMVFNFLLALLFSTVMSFFMTWLSAGISPANPIFVSVFIRGFVTGFALAIPLSYIFVPLVMKFVVSRIK